MKLARDGVIVFALLAGGAVSATTFPGEVVSVSAQAVFAPQSSSVPVPLVNFVKDGVFVHRGDIVASTDSSLAAARTDHLESENELAARRWDKDVANLRVKAVEADVALVIAKSDYELAKLDEGLPRNLISSLDFDRFHSEFRRASVALDSAEKAQRNSRETVERAILEARIDAVASAARVAKSRAQEEMGRVFARVDGTVVHSYKIAASGGEPYAEGGSALPGAEIGKVVPNDEKFSLHIWPLVSEAERLRIGQEVRFGLDSQPGKTYVGSVTFIGGATSKRPIWGKSSYVDVIVSVPSDAQKSMLAGMSVTADDDLHDEGIASLGLPSGTRRRVTLRGQTYARETSVVISPSSSDVGRLTIASVVRDGEHVTAGQTLVAFDRSVIDGLVQDARRDANEAAESLRSVEAESQDREKESELEVADAMAAAVKAGLKANVPVKYTASLQVKKLLIERDRAESIARFTQKKAQYGRAGRLAELTMSEVRVRAARNRELQLETLSKQFVVKSAVDGSFYKQSSADGRKLDSGAVIYGGQAIGFVARPLSVAVHAAIPERQIREVHEGQKVIVRFHEKGYALSGRIAHLGRTVHLEAETGLMPVLSADIELDSQPSEAGLGASVDIEVIEEAS
jgi:multidrug resistance efflux pump